MAAASPSDIRVYLLSTEGVLEPRDLRPLEMREPEEILFGCFFHDDDDRASLLSYLREIATPTTTEDPEAMTTGVARELEDCRLRSDTAGLLVTAVRWWTGVKRRGYHAYKLRAGVDRYRCSCVIAFRERTPFELKNAIEPAIEELEESKERVAGFFQYPFD